MKNEKQKNLEARILKMKAGESFSVETESDRQRASKAGNILRRAGLVEFVVKTFQRDGKFIVEAA